MRETWYVHPNDLIDGWSVMSVDRPPSALVVGDEGREVATFVSEDDARRIVDLNNADLAGRLLPDVGETREDARVTYRLPGVDRQFVNPAGDRANAAEVAANVTASFGAIDVVTQVRSVWTGPWVEVTDGAR